MSGFFIVPILGEHVEDQLRTPGSPPADEAEKDAFDHAEKDAFDHELSGEPQPYFPADEAESADQKQS
jgi:hypothetical protein